MSTIIPSLSTCHWCMLLQSFHWCQPIHRFGSSQNLVSHCKPLKKQGNIEKFSLKIIVLYHFELTVRALLDCVCQCISFAVLWRKARILDVCAVLIQFSSGVPPEEATNTESEMKMDSEIKSCDISGLKHEFSSYPAAQLPSALPPRSEHSDDV